MPYTYLICIRTVFYVPYDRSLRRSCVYTVVCIKRLHRVHGSEEYEHGECFHGIGTALFRVAVM